ncbi:MAG: hypothetical protein F4Y69_04380 [Chloroflexi bacterium]|nr:hypothetical protein [Chloroflexota bacterium]MYF21761.1 hypothetical protein [Chloroflexota bacterium]
MTTIDANGIFWDADAPEHQVPGRLRFDSQAGIELALTGAFDDVPDTDTTPGVPIPARQIHGVAGDGIYTLLGCGSSNYQYGFPGVFQSQTFLAQALLKGVHLAPSDLAGVTSIAIQSRHLASWADCVRAVEEHDYDERSGRLVEYRLSYRPPTEDPVSIPNAEISLRPTFQISGASSRQARLDYGCVLKLETSGPSRIEDLIGRAITVRNLLSLAIDAPERIESAFLSHPDYLEDGLHGTQRPIAFELFRRWDHNSSSYPERDVQRFDMLFTLSDLGGLEGIGNWLELSAEYDVIIQSALAMQFMPTQFVDARFLSVAGSADALARIHSGDADMEYRQRLEYLGNLAGNVFTDWVGDLELWSKVVKEERNNVAHGEDKSTYQQYRPPRQFLSHSVYYLVILCLMRILGVGAVAIEGMREKHRFIQLQEMFGHYFTS